MTVQKAAASIAAAVAIAEGYPVRGSRAWADSNPGNFEAGDHGHGLDGKLTIFASHAEGWAFAQAFWERILAGAHPLYKLPMTIAQVAEHYDGEPQYMQWATNVATVLKVTTTTKLSDLLT